MLLEKGPILSLRTVTYPIDNQARKSDLKTKMKFIQPVHINTYALYGYMCLWILSVKLYLVA